VLEPALLKHPTCNLRVSDFKLTFQGILRDADVGKWLQPIIDRVHREAVHKSAAEVVIDIRGVEYANASAWKCFVYWLRLLTDDSAAHYGLRIVCDGTRHWQQVGVPFLRVFGADRLTLIMNEETSSE